jgi:hypothetical protein
MIGLLVYLLIGLLVKTERLKRLQAGMSAVAGLGPVLWRRCPQGAAVQRAAAVGGDPL